MSYESVKKELLKDIENVNNLDELNEMKIKYLSKKGLISELNSEIKNIPNEEKKNV